MKYMLLIIGDESQYADRSEEETAAALQLWDEYTKAYRDALRLCSTPWAPWYVVPADDKKARNYLIAQTVVEMERGFLFLMSVSDGSSLAVLAHPECDIGLVGYEMAMLVARCGDVLTPALRAELQAALPR